MIAFSGVRSSWLMLARNSLLCWLAISSCRLLSWISRNSRAFWMAITAWSAKVCANATSLGSKAPRLGTQDADAADARAIAHQRHEQRRAPADLPRQIGGQRVVLGHRLGVGDGHHARLQHTGAGDTALVEWKVQGPLLAAGAGVRGARHAVQALALGQQQVHRHPAEQALAAGDDGVEHRLRIGHRAADHLQDLGRGGLLLQCLTRLVEQAHVLDGDHRLVGESPGQRHLLVVEGAGGPAQDADHRQRLLAAQQRHEQARTVAQRAGQVAHARKLQRADGGVGDVDDAALQQGRPGRAAAVQRPGLQEAAAALARRAVGGKGQRLDHVAARHRNGHRAAVEQPLAGLHDGLEHRLHVGGRTADHRQDAGRGRLLLERLLRLVEQAHVLDGDHRLVGKGLEQRDLLVGQRAWCSARSPRWRRWPRRRAPSAPPSSRGSRPARHCACRLRTGRRSRAGRARRPRGNREWPRRVCSRGSAGTGTPGASARRAAGRPRRWPWRAPRRPAAGSPPPQRRGTGGCRCARWHRTPVARRWAIR